MNERLQEIKNKLEKARGKRGMQDAIYAEYGDWLLSQAEKVEQLQQENERLNTLLDQSRAGKLAVSRRLEFAGEEIDRLKADIEEALELLKRGGPGTRSQVQRLLEQALEGES
jgi:uncharacterized protein YicC (UPF0701 family)